MFQKNHGGRGGFRPASGAQSSRTIKTTGTLYASITTLCAPFVQNLGEEEAWSFAAVSTPLLCCFRREASPGDVSEEHLYPLLNWKMQTSRPSVTTNHVALVVQIVGATGVDG